MKIRLSELFFIFFKISIILIGGGYVLLPISIDEFVKKRKLLTNEQIVDFYALSQCLPGVIVIKTATFIGYHLRGKTGAVVSVLGLVTPPFLAIIAVAYLIQSIDPKILEIINTITIAVIVLVGASFAELFSVCIKNLFTVLLFIATSMLFIFTNFQPVIIILFMTVIGILLKTLIRKLKGDSK